MVSVEEDLCFDIVVFLRKIKFVWSCKVGFEFGVVNLYGEDERWIDWVNLVLVLFMFFFLYFFWKRYV